MGKKEQEQETRRKNKHLHFVLFLFFFPLSEVYCLWLLVFSPSLSLIRTKLQRKIFRTKQRRQQNSNNNNNISIREHLLTHLLNNLRYSSGNNNNNNESKQNKTKKQKRQINKNVVWIICPWSNDCHLYLYLLTLGVNISHKARSCQKPLQGQCSLAICKNSNFTNAFARARITFTRGDDDSGNSLLAAGLLARLQVRLYIYTRIYSFAPEFKADHDPSSSFKRLVAIRSLNRRRYSNQHRITESWSTQHINWSIASLLLSLSLSLFPTRTSTSTQHIYIYIIHFNNSSSKQVHGEQWWTSRTRTQSRTP